MCIYIAFCSPFKSYRIVSSFERLAVEFVLDPNFPLNEPTVVTADNMAFTALKVLKQTVDQKRIVERKISIVKSLCSLCHFSRGDHAFDLNLW